jgi:NADPH:quinone reductase-like Zn-dependent oxidoreductase
VLRPVAGSEYPLEAAAQAQADILKNSACGKLVLKIV